MSFGHNTNATFQGTTYHVQTESHGSEHPYIDTTVYLKGQVLHRRTNGYQDLLPLTPENEHILGARVDAQHHAVVDEIRAGSLLAAVPAGRPASVSAGVQTAPRGEIEVELLNARGWLAANRAHLEVAVREKGTGRPVAAARVAARIEGAVTKSETTAETDPEGLALIVFEMPRLAAADAALVLEVRKGIESAHLRFQLHAKHKTSPAGAP